MRDKAVFCTALLDADISRYKTWIDYNSKLLPDVDLWLFNDGPTELAWEHVNVCSFEEKLGRINMNVVPGWKRSFSWALKILTDKYSYIAHIESDCWLLRSGLSEFNEYLTKEGYYTGYCNKYDFPESSLQIINSDSVKKALIEKYDSPDAWYEDIVFEKYILSFNPAYILKGDRMEANWGFRPQDWTYIANTKYDDAKEYLDS